MRAAVLMLLAVLAATTTPLQAQAQAAAPNSALEKFPPPGRMVDIGGRRLHLLCKGPSRGPTAIIETGAVASSLYYWKAQDSIAEVARVCTYDRAGFGWSDPASYPRTLRDRVEDLHALLRKSGAARPYILVGHSMGALLVRAYAKAYPRDVAGIVLVEGSDPAFNGRPDNLQRVAASAKLMGMAVQAAAAGIEVPQLKAPGAPPEEAVALRATVFRAGQDDLEMMASLPDQVAAVGSLDSLGDLPLVVVRRGKADAGLSAEANDAWIAMQEANVKLSSHSALMVAENSGHNVPHDQPEIFGAAVGRLLALRSGR
jgi:pimeloyl-ACP methyl ester carboxylesterase